MNELNKIEKEYYKELKTFQDICYKLNKNKLYFVTIVLNHELFRFLYPTEPYCDFKHSDHPATEILSLLKKLSSLGNNHLATLKGYPNSDFHSENSDQKGDIENKTSELYSKLWEGYNEEILLKESKDSIINRIGEKNIIQHIKNKSVLDLGCGSGRYSLALSMLGAKHVTGMDLHSHSYESSSIIAKKNKLNVSFVEGNALNLPFEDYTFDFVFSNGVLHHTQNWKNALDEYYRVMKFSGFLYLYATDGFFWTTRKVMRKIFEDIPKKLCFEVLKTLGMPSNRMIFMDVWYVPIEEHISKKELEQSFNENHLKSQKLVSKKHLDIDRAVSKYGAEGSIVWGEGEHRYLLEKSK